MKRIILRAMPVLTGAFFFFAAHAQVSENFNTRPLATATSDIKPYLQDHCWFLPDMDINQSGWNPGLEGDGALVSGPGSGPSENTGIYTPLLDVPGSMVISFRYAFNTDVDQRRWIRIFLTDFDNNIYQLLDSVEFTGKNANTTYTYSNTFYNLPSVGGRLYINYQGSGEEIRIAIDQLSINLPL